MFREYEQSDQHLIFSICLLDIYFINFYKTYFKSTYQ